MKRFLLLLFLLLAARAEAQTSYIVATVTVTNGITNGWVLSVNGNTRLFTNVVVSPVTNIYLTNTTISATATNATNIYLAYLAYPDANCYCTLGPNSNQVQFTSYPSLSPTLTISTNGGAATSYYLTWSYSTITITNLMGLRVPVPWSASSLGAYERTNAESGIVGLLSDTAATNVVNPAVNQWKKFAALTNTFITNGIFASTNWIGTNKMTIWATNSTGAGTNWLAYTNVNPGAASAYFVTFSVWGTDYTNSTDWFLQSSKYTVTNSASTTGCAVTNAITAATYGSGLSGTVAISNSVIASAGFGITIVGSPTNVMHWLTETEVFTP